MKNPHRTWLAAALLATAVAAQAPTPQQQLDRAQLIETKEHDLAAAEQAYRTLLSDPTPAEVTSVASLRLGALLWRLERRDEAKTFLEHTIEIADKYGGDRTAAAQAKAILQGQGEDAKLAQERLTKARALVELLVTKGSQDSGNPVENLSSGGAQVVVDDLKPLGAQAAEALVERLDLAPSTQGPGTWAKGVDVAIRRRLMGLLWEVGTGPAASALRRWGEADELRMRLEAAQGAGGAAKIAPDLVPSVLAYLRDPDPSGEVWRAAALAVGELKHEQHLELLAAADAPARAAGLDALARTWHSLTDQQREHFAAHHGDAVRAATRDTDTRVADRAWRLIHELAGGPTSATFLFFAEADRYPDNLGPIVVNHAIEANDLWLHTLTDAAQRASLPARAVLQTLLRFSRHTWTRAAVDDVLTLLDRGYTSPEGADWAVRALRLADGEQLARLIAMMPRAGSREWVRELGYCAPLPTTFPPLRDVIDRSLAGAPMPWDAPPAPSPTAPAQQQLDNAPVMANRMVRGRMVPVQLPGSATSSLLATAFATMHADVPGWFAGLVDRHPGLATICVNALVSLSIDGAGEPARAGLRKLLVWEGNEQNELLPQERALVFAELARAGDVAAIPLYPRAHELGLAPTTPKTATSRTRTAFASWGFLASGIAYLGEYRFGGLRLPWHGYADADLVTAWRTLLDAPQLQRVVQEFADPQSSQFPGRNLSSLRIPNAVLPLVLERLPKLVAGASRDTRNELSNVVGSSLGDLTPEHIRDDAALRAAIAALLHGDDATAPWFFGRLQDGVAREFATEAAALFRRHPESVSIEKLRAAGIPLGDDDWTAALGASDSARVAALDQLPKERGAMLRAAVEAQLAHAEAAVRSAAVGAVQRLYGQGGVTSLLPLLQDPEQTVRDRARAALASLREDAEQRAFWANAGNGIDTSQRGAAAKLIAQAQPGEPKEQRVLAIRSLAVLGAAESLPYLIDATKDKDGDVATAAREAIATIHGKAGSPAPANK